MVPGELPPPHPHPKGPSRPKSGGSGPQIPGHSREPAWQQYSDQTLNLCQAGKPFLCEASEKPLLMTEKKKQSLNKEETLQVPREFSCPRLKGQRALFVGTWVPL